MVFLQFPQAFPACGATGRVCAREELARQAGVPGDPRAGAAAGRGKEGRKAVTQRSRRCPGTDECTDG